MLVVEIADPAEAGFEDVCGCVVSWLNNHPPRKATMNITEYVKREQIIVKIVEEIGYDRDEIGWEHNAYTLQLLSPLRGSEEFAWRQGLGISESPVERPDMVLDSLVSDAMSYRDAQDFEDWARDFGYDTDSRKAEALYEACGEVAEWLEHFLGGRENLEFVAYEVERL